MKIWENSLKLGHLIRPRVYSYATLSEAAPEELIDGVRFKIYKYNIRKRPSKGHIVILSCFSEFGSELVGSLYCIPRMLQNRYLGYYVIAMGWKGRSYLYKHLVDEFWELEDEYQWLREYCRAYHHASINLRRVEHAVKQYGILVNSDAFTSITLQELYPNLTKAKKTACWVPEPSLSARNSVAKYLKSNSVGVIARYRKCYGRNLQIDFYKRLIDLLQEMGYDPIWMGEPATTYECPYSHITDFRSSLEAADLEKTLALTASLKFTIQFWTASTRLAGLVGTPYIIFESPEQIYGDGHEGFRQNLCTKGSKKLVISHFWNTYYDHEGALALVRRAVNDVIANNWSDIIGLVESDKIVGELIEDNIKRVYGDERITEYTELFSKGCN